MIKKYLIRDNIEYVQSNIVSHICPPHVAALFCKSSLPLIDPKDVDHNEYPSY